MERLEFHPVTVERWDDLDALFGPRGACGGCWCMYWRLGRKEFQLGKGSGNRRALRRLVRRGQVPGILAYAKGRPVGWCALGPRDAFPALDRSRILAAVDDRPVWCAPCLFVARDYRRRGLSTALLKAACRLARKDGARAVEGYPIEPKRGRLADAFAWTGLASAFRSAGFSEVLRRSPTRPIMRRSFRG
jgi:GNAT superfamily N-acetyltransferase